MKELKITRGKLIGILIMIAIIGVSGWWIHRNWKVKFADDKMHQVMCMELGYDKEYQNLKYKDLDNIERLKIGPIGTFETIRDVAKCKNLKELAVNVDMTEWDAYCELFEKTETGEIYCPVVNDERVANTQKELVEILKKAKGIKKIVFSNCRESCNIKDLAFLKYGRNLKRVSLAYLNITDYSDLKNCQKIERLSLRFCSIERADALPELKNLKEIVLTGTPLSKNEKELEKLKEAFPGINILIDEVEE